jgi:hypothetical protein
VSDQHELVGKDFRRTFLIVNQLLKLINWIVYWVLIDLDAAQELVVLKFIHKGLRKKWSWNLSILVNFKVLRKRLAEILFLCINIHVLFFIILYLLLHHVIWLLWAFLGWISLYGFLWKVIWSAILRILNLLTPAFFIILLWVHLLYI